ncbi:MAG: YciI family protein [Candidatus Eisenbacteria bacterium]
MKQFMFLYKGGDPDWATKASPEEMAAVMAKWGTWLQSLGAAGKLVTGGSPLAYEGKKLTKDGVVTDISAAEIKELVSGYSIVEAENYDEALALARDCPMFASPNAHLEVREVILM